MTGHKKPLIKIVARLRDGKLVHGYLDELQVGDLEAFSEPASPSMPEQINLRVVESGETISVHVDSIKALFFVRSFEGGKEYREVKFFDRNPTIKGLWVRVKFYDKESLEGIVRNSVDFLVKPGFFLKPPDPASNNELVYVSKKSLVDFSVLGVRTDY